MKKKKIIVAACLSSVLALAAFTLVSSNGTQTFETNSPADGPGDCSGCHSGGSATAVMTVTATPAFGAGNTYMPNTNYVVAVSVTGYPKYGFDLEITNGQLSTSVDGGTPGAVISNTRKTAGPPTNYSHSTPITTGTKATFNWKSPASGAVYIYASGLGVNGNGSTSGDKLVKFAMTLNQTPLGTNDHSQNLSQFNVFPNPVMDNIIHLNYSLDKTSSVSIQLFDMNGRLVADLLNETQDAGEKKFDSALPATLSKGIYSLNLVVEGERIAKKLVVK
ncbi:MAG TPA: choice-of-anchor V domain-containing protein [Bacteroidia bacterium]|jgi:hypothetical protein|nr:choice-of-anchor V domain-containing protein [Bacteroidia bacterium]